MTSTLLKCVLAQLLIAFTVAASPIDPERSIGVTSAVRGRPAGCAPTDYPQSPGLIYLTFELDSPKSRLVVRTAHSCTLYELDSAESIAEAAYRYRSQLVAPPSEAAVRATRRWSQALWNALLAPAEAELRVAQTLVVVAEGALRDLAFETLLDAGGKYLIEYAPVWYGIRSSESIAGLAHAPAPTKDWRILSVGVGDIDETSPVESGSVREARALADRFASERKKLLIGKSATKNSFLGAELSEFDLIHIAAHGLADEENPENSVLFFRDYDHDRASTELTAREVAATKTLASLVVLSGCETGLLQRTRAAGSLGDGLAAAFLTAGASEVIASSWVINDHAAVDFMSLFYDRLLEGSTVASALRHAKLDMIRSERIAYRLPYFWGAYRNLKRLVDTKTISAAEVIEQAISDLTPLVIGCQISSLGSPAAEQIALESLTSSCVDAEPVTIPAIARSIDSVLLAMSSGRYAEAFIRGTSPRSSQLGSGLYVGTILALDHSVAFPIAQSHSALSPFSTLEVDWRLDRNWPDSNFDFSAVAMKVTYDYTAEGIDVPEPPVVVLFGLGIAGLFIVRREKRK